MNKSAGILLTTLAIALMAMCGCNRKITPGTPVVTHDSTLTSVTNSFISEDKPGIPDSSMIRALLQCDSLGNVYLATITQLQGKIVNQAVSLENNKLTVEAKASTREKKEVARKDSIRIETREIPVPYPVKTVTNRLTSWQSFQIWTGRLVLVGLMLYLGFNSRFSFISKLFK